MKKVFGYILKGVNILLNIVGAIILLLTISFIVWQLYLFLFYPVNVPINAQITDFETIDISSNVKCAETSNLEKSVDYPFQLVLSNISPYFQNYKIGSSEPIVFDLAFNNGEYKVHYETEDNSLPDIEGTLGEEYKRLQGVMQGISIDFSNVEYLDVVETICAPRITFMNSSSNYFSAWTSFDSESDNYNAIRTAQEIPADSTILITFSGPVNLNEYPGKKIEKISITLKSTAEISKLLVGLEGYNFSTDLPNVVATLDEETDTRQIPLGNSFFINSYIVQNVEISAPVGKVQFGSFEIALTAPYTSFSNITLELPSSPINLSDTIGSMQFHSNLTNSSFTIDGLTSRILYRKKVYGNSRWQMLPGDFQAGLLGIMVSVFGGLWAIRHPLRKWILSQFPFLKSKGDLPIGSYVFVMDSGVVIAGELSRKPAKNYPYYLVKNAKRKLSLSGEWEKDIISEIKIRADAVEQTYVA